MWNGQSKLDPYLLVGEKVICISYVDDLIFWAGNERDIHHIPMKLRGVGVDLEQETDAARFLGIQMECDPDGLLEMKQESLTLCIIEAMGLDIGTVTPKWMPAESAPLVKDAEGFLSTCAFSYSSVVGMLLYFSGHTCPDIAYVVNCAACYMFCPKKSQEEALKHLGRYLKATHNRGLIINPSSGVLKIDAYPEAVVGRLYSIQYKSIFGAPDKVRRNTCEQA